MPRLNVSYVAATDIGLFEQSNPHYGEINYSLNGRTATSRATTPEAALETIFELAGIASLPEDSEDNFRGHPLAVPPRGAPMLFYVAWPAVVAACGFFIHWRNR